MMNSHSSVGLERQEIRRPLSPLERWYWVLDQVSPLNVIGWVTVKGSITEDSLSKAAQFLSVRHPLLRVSIRSDSVGAHPSFVAPDSPVIPIRHVDAGGDPTRWKAEIQSYEMATSLDWSNRCLARIAHVVNARGTSDESHVIILTLSHVVADAQTVTSLVSELVEMASEFCVEDESEHYRSSPDCAVLAPDAALPASHRGIPGIWRLIRSAIAQSRLKSRDRLRVVASKEVRPSDRRTRFVSFELVGEDVARLNAKCGEMGVSLKSALTVALGVAVKESLYSGQGGVVDVGVGIDTRDVLVPGVHASEMGPFTTLNVARIGFEPGVGLSFWSAVQLAESSNHKAVACGDHLIPLVAMKFIAPKSLAESGKAIRMAEQSGPGNLISIVREGESARFVNGDWDVSDPAFVVTMSTTGYLGVCSSVSESAVRCNIVFVDEAVDSEAAELIALSMKLALQSPR